MKAMRRAAWSVVQPPECDQNTPFLVFLVARFD